MGNQVKNSKSFFKFLKTLKKFGLKKPLTFSSPLSVIWEITHQCNLRCRHCSANAGNKSKDELTTKEALKTIDKLYSFGVNMIAFSGGEPLLRKDIFKLTKYASEKGIYVQIDTNGTLITKEKAREMKNSGIRYIRISLDSSSDKFHDSLRGSPGAFDKTIEGIKNVVGDFDVSTCTTITKSNYKEFEKIIGLSESLGVNRVLFDEFIPVGRAKELLKYDLQPEEREEFLKSLYKKMKESRVDIVAAFCEITRVAYQIDGCRKIAPTYYVNFRGFFKKIKAKFLSGCPAGHLGLKISPNGDINPCSFLDMKIGNVLKDDLNDMWENNKILINLRDRDILRPHCGRCKYRYICGGCRARAYAYFDDYLAQDPGCIYNKK